MQIHKHFLDDAHSYTNIFWTGALTSTLQWSQSTARRRARRTSVGEVWLEDDTHDATRGVFLIRTLFGFVGEVVAVETVNEKETGW